MRFILRAVRISCGYTEEEVAGYCGISTEAINRLEIDSSEIEYRLLTKLTGLYKVAPDLVYFGVEADCHKRSLGVTKG